MESQTIKYLRLEWFLIVIDRGFDQSSTSTISSMGVFKKGASSKAATAWTSGAYKGVREHGQGARPPLAAFFRWYKAGRTVDTRQKNQSPSTRKRFIH
jgi:hypothetical protein